MSRMPPPRSVAAFRVGGFDIAAVTDQGPVRAENQDVWRAIAMDGGVLLVLADGLGGAVDGGTAARLAVDAVVETAQQRLPDEDMLVRLVEAASAAVGVHARLLGAMTGSTLEVVALAANRRVRLAHVGDSRVYRLREGTAERLTRDHTTLDEAIAAGRVPADQARRYNRNQLSRAITGEPVVADLGTTTVENDDVLLLCSDGLWDPLGDAALEAAISRGGPLDAGLNAACAAALAAGSTDNVTALAARVSGG